MDFDFKAICEFNDYFKDEKTCYEFLENQRWSGSPVCPHCGSMKAPYKVKARGKFQDIPSYRCSERACDLPFTVRTNSIYEGSKVELRKWFQAVYEINISKKGISSVELATRIGVSQKTAWFINHRLRAMLTETNPELLTGMVEVDETYIGGKEKNKSKKVRAANIEKIKELHPNRKPHANALDTKTPVLGILQRDGLIRVTPMVAPSKEILLDQINKNISPDATVVTDGLQAYRNISKTHKEHVFVNHNNDEWVKGQFHTNNIEGFWSILKRGIIGTFHVVSPQHLHRYCDEFAYRYNNRQQSLTGKFEESLKQFDSVRLTYRELTPDQREPHRKARYNKTK